MKNRSFVVAAVCVSAAVFLGLDRQMLKSLKENGIV